MVATTLKLTVEAARKSQPGEILRCHVVKGLELWTKETGAAWYLYYRNHAGDRRRPKLGNWPALPIERAREAAREMLERIAKGEDPSGERQRLRAASSFADLCDAYIAFKAQTNKPRSMEEIRRHVRVAKAEIGDVRAEDVALPHVNRVLAAVADRKHAAGTQPCRMSAPVAANRQRETLRGILNYAERPSVGVRRPNTNPIGETAKNREHKRRVTADENDLRRLAAAFRVLSAIHPAEVAALLTILYCGTRVTELLSATARQYVGGKITLDEHKTDRTGDARVIYAPAQAQRLIAAIQAKGARGEALLFGGIDRYSVFRVWEKARELSGCNLALTVRDLRRTFASVALSQAGASLDQIGELFGHRDTATTAGYSWLLDGAAKDISQRTADKIETMLTSDRADKGDAWSG